MHKVCLRKAVRDPAPAPGRVAAQGAAARGREDERGWEGKVSGGLPSVQSRPDSNPGP